MSDDGYERLAELAAARARARAARVATAELPARLGASGALLTRSAARAHRRVDGAPARWRGRRSLQSQCTTRSRSARPRSARSCVASARAGRAMRGYAPAAAARLADRPRRLTAKEARSRADDRNDPHGWGSRGPRRDARSILPPCPFRHHPAGPRAGHLRRLAAPAGAAEQPRQRRHARLPAPGRRLPRARSPQAMQTPATRSASSRARSQPQTDPHDDCAPTATASTSTSSPPSIAKNALEYQALVGRQGAHRRSSSPRWASS